MISDPFKVLGVPSTATDEEIKKAYRNLAKRYHPDSHPGDKYAEQKMKEINAAYDQITHKKDANTGSPYRGNDPFGGFGGYEWQSSSTRTESANMRAARNYINSRYYQDALYVLNNISERNARWYYYSALANAGVGNRIQAQQHAQQAVQMDPGNIEYQSLLIRLQNLGQTYSSASKEYSMPGVTPSKLCFGIILLNILCRLFGFC